jgi:hypothetical protein
MNDGKVTVTFYLLAVKVGTGKGAENYREECVQFETDQHSQFQSDQ